MEGPVHPAGEGSQQGICEIPEAALSGKGKIFSLPVIPFLSSCSILAVISRMSYFLLCTATLCDSVKFYALIDCHLNCLCNGFIIKYTVNNVGTRKYCIQYTMGT